MTEICALALGIIILAILGVATISSMQGGTLITLLRSLTVFVIVVLIAALGWGLADAVQAWR